MINMVRFQYMFQNQVTADVEFDYSTKEVQYKTYTDNIYLLPFGVNMKPKIPDVSRFLESRCFPKERRNRNQLLEDLELDAFVPLEIVRKTHGILLEDYCWIRFEREDLEYERDIKLRD